MMTIRMGGHGPTTYEQLKGLRAEGYIRDSTLDQKDGYGPELQRRAIENFAHTYGLALGKAWYTDFITGTSTLKRAGFQHAIQDAQVDRFDVLLVYHTSRFARNRADAIRYKDELRKLGKALVFVSQGIISGNDNDFLNEGINEVLDEQYSKNLSRWVRDGLRVKASEGYSLGKAPLGFRHQQRSGGRGVRTVPDEGTLPALLAMLEGYASGIHSFMTLAQELNAKGYRTITGKPFTESSVSTALNNPFYKGEIIYHRGKPDQEIRQGVHVVPKEVIDLWQRCQDMRVKKATPGHPSPPSRGHHVYPLTGVLICDNCDQPFHGVTKSEGAYLDNRMWHSKRRCTMRPLSVKVTAVEKEFAGKVISQIELDDGWRGAVLKAMTNEGPQPDYTLELKRMDNAMVNLKKQHLWGVITDEEFRKEFISMERQKRALEAAGYSVMTPNLDRSAEILSNLSALWQHPGVSRAEQRELAREVFQEVRLKEGKLAAVKPRPEYAPLFAYSLWRYNLVGGERLC